MILNAYAVLDSKAEAFLPPFFLPNHQMALRAFQTAANDPSHAFSMHPDDYTLFHVGNFVSSAEGAGAAGTLTGTTTPLSLGLASTLISSYAFTEGTDPANAPPAPSSMTTIYGDK